MKREEGYFTMMLRVDNKTISIKPVVKCPEDKSHLIHCVLTCNAPLCPKEATELLFIWTLCEALTCPLSSQALLQTYCHNKQYRKHLKVSLAQKEGKKSMRAMEGWSTCHEWNSWDSPDSESRNRQTKLGVQIL